MKRIWGFAFAKAGDDIYDKLNKYVAAAEGDVKAEREEYLPDGNEVAEEEDVSSCELFDEYSPVEILLTKDGKAVCEAKLTDVDWAKTFNVIKATIGDIKCFMKADEDELVNSVDWEWEPGEDSPDGRFGWHSYIWAYAVKLLREDLEAKVYALCFHVHQIETT